MTSARVTCTSKNVRHIPVARNKEWRITVVEADIKATL